MRSQNATASLSENCVVKGAASKKRKTYRTPDFINGRFGRPLLFSFTNIINLLEKPSNNHNFTISKKNMIGLSGRNS